MPPAGNTSAIKTAERTLTFNLNPTRWDMVRERMLPWIVFLAATAYLCAFCRYSAIEPDEGIILRGAERILNGEVPYRDFFSFYTPGSYYLIAGLFRIFGDSFLVARTSLAVAGGLCAAITYLLARRFCTSGIAIFAAVLTTVAGVSYRFLVLHNWYSTFLCCVALYAALRWLETRTSLWGFLAGLFSSLTVLFEQSKGAGLCLGLVAGGAIAVWKYGPRWGRRDYVPVATGFLLPLLITFAYFAHAHALGEMVRAWLWPLGHYTSANHVPYGYQNWSNLEQQEIFHRGSIGMRAVKLIALSPGLIVPTLPVISIFVLAYLALLARQPRGESGGTRVASYLLVCSTCVGVWLSVVASRADVIHFMYLAPLWYVVLAWILGARSLKEPLLTVRRLLFAYVTVAFGLMGFALFLRAQGTPLRIQTRRGMIATSFADTVIPYVENHTRPGDQILVYPYLPLYNYLTGTKSPAPLDYFQPGMNTPEQATQILEALRSGRSQGVLFEPGFAEKVATAWPGTPASAITSDPVADYIRQNYRVCESLQSPTGWRFEFRVQKDANCP